MLNGFGFFRFLSLLVIQGGHFGVQSLEVPWVPPNSFGDGSDPSCRRFELIIYAITPRKSIHLVLFSLVPFSLCVSPILFFVQSRTVANTTATSLA